MHDILLLMCRIPSFGNIFGGRKYHVYNCKVISESKDFKKTQLFSA